MLIFFRFFLLFDQAVRYLCCHVLLLGPSERKGQKRKRPLALFDNQPSKRPRGELTDHEGKIDMSKSSTFIRCISVVVVV